MAASSLSESEPIVIKVGTSALPESRWQAADGTYYVQGDFTADGMIVGETGILLRAGVVWIERSKLENALSHGWSLHADYGNMIQVSRR